MSDNNDDDAPHVLRYRDYALNATHSRYDRLVAGGTDLERWRSWVAYASITLAVAAFVLMVLIAILRQPRVRRKPFNVFLIFLMVPDVCFSLLCGVNCILNARHGDYISQGWCHFHKKCDHFTVKCSALEI